ncbi:MAG: class I SAM-dependent methyltransferase [Nitrospina sp.]|jgi:ubiquinone/menaquinone biosynthesis C-methylase UbiE|nr:class I SAM-dependent methyltransferase [Nitrospina sp.]MBT5633135.1 class I SAM-dependent methyltransferase [Nitrospina sp.]
MSFVYMKILESRPERYDIGMGLLTLGSLSKIKQQIANHAQPGNQVLDLGCGTGTLAKMCIDRGALVTGVDSNSGMLAVAKRNSPTANYLNISLSNLDEHLEDESFDIILSTLAFSELTRAERIHVMKQIKRVLKNGGKVLIGDEIIPDNFPAKCFYYAFRLPMRLLTWIMTQTTTNAIPSFEEEVREAGMKIVNSKSYMWGMFLLLEIEK